ncbi:MAG: cbb3-type cytochrome oxidase assembly protein CcoS [Bacteriovoracaceae bacterium]|nr:cbb3-type cytochrome oxidase assembly protein CcoS [Bacteriovoracaceae bacterium]
MEIIYFMVPLAFLLGVLFVVFFIWTVKKNQYDDLDKSAQKILIDDEPIKRG